MSVASLGWRGPGSSGAARHLSLVWGQPRFVSGKSAGKGVGEARFSDARQLNSEKQLPLIKSTISRKSRPVHSCSEARGRGGPSDHSQTSSPCPGAQRRHPCPLDGASDEPPAPQDTLCAGTRRVGARTSQTLGHRDPLSSSLPSGRVRSGQTLLWFSQGEALERTVNLASETREGKQRL